MKELSLKCFARTVNKGFVLRSFICKLFYSFRIPVLFLIFLYQKTISPDHGMLKGFFPHGQCRFHPTCSVYGFQAIEKYGLIKGGALTIARIIRCNPWNKGGYDPLR